MIWIAIDPGSSSGAIAYKSNRSDAVGPYGVMDMPQTPEAMWHMLGRENTIKGAVVERVGGSMPGNAARAARTFATHMGHLEMALIAAGIPVVANPLPKQWMTDLFGDRLPHGMSPLEKKARKDFIYAEMVKKYPGFRIKKPQADALGILTWAEMKIKEKLPW